MVLAFIAGMKRTSILVPRTTLNDKNSRTFRLETAPDTSISTVSCSMVSNTDY